MSGYENSVFSNSDIDLEDRFLKEDSNKWKNIWVTSFDFALQNTKNGCFCAVWTSFSDDQIILYIIENAEIPSKNEFISTLIIFSDSITVPNIS